MRVLTAAIISEGLLALLALAAQAVSGISFPWNPSVRALVVGLLFTVPPLVANHYLWQYSKRSPTSVYHHFSEEIILPLCRQVSVRLAIVIAVLSGLCEEWFFRGALNVISQEYCGALASCLITSVLFASVHFIGSFKRYGGMIPLYTAMGVYLWGVHRITGSLAAVALLHGLYNLIVIVSIRYDLFTHNRHKPAGHD